MLGKIKAAVTAGWFLTLVGLVLLSALIWFAGPFIAIADRPILAGAVTRLVVILVLFVVWGVYNLLQAQAALRKNAEFVDTLTDEAGEGELEPEPVKEFAEDEHAEIATRLDEALSVLKSSRFGDKGDYLYQLPWYVIIGPPGAGKTTALLNSGLRFPLAEHGAGHVVKGEGGTRRCDWWFTDDAVLIDTAGRYTVQDSDAAQDSAGWFGFLDLLKKRRPQRPLNGVVVAISALDLLSGDETVMERHAEAIRSRIEELNARLGVSLPIYVVVTKVDLLNGFTEYFEDIGQEDRRQVWGVTLPVDRQASLSASIAAFDRESDSLADRLSSRTVFRLHEETDFVRRTQIFSFPQQFAELRRRTSAFLRRTFEESRFRTKPFLRGAYFTSGTQEGAPIDRLLGSLAAGLGGRASERLVGRATGKSFFLHDLLRDVIFAEANLAGADPTAERRANQRHWAAVAAGFAALAVAAGLWTWSYMRNASRLADLGADVDAFAAAASELPADRRAENLAVAAPALDRIRNATFSGYADETARRSAGFSFGLGQTGRARARLMAAYDQALETALLPQILARLESQLAPSALDPELAFEALRVYLMAGGQGPLDRDAVLGWLTATWTEDYPGAANSDLRASFLNHAARLYAQPVDPQALDDGLIQAARTVIRRQPPATLAYAQFRFDSEIAAAPDWSVYGNAGPQSAQLFEGDQTATSVPGLFTRQSYMDLVKDKIRAYADATQENSWVMGAAQPEGAVAVNRASLQEDVERLYFAEFTEVWRRHFSTVSIVRPTCEAMSGAAGAECLKATADVIRIAVGPAAPLKTYLIEAARATDLSENEAGGSVVDEVARRNAKLRRASATASRLGVGAGELLDPVDLVIDEFAELGAFVTAPEGGVSPLDNALSLLRDYADALDLAADEFTDGAAKATARSAADRLRRSAEKFPPPASRLFSAFLTAGDEIVAQQSLKQINDAFQAGVGQECATALPGRFPFDPASPNNLLLGDFTRIFGPGGMLDSFFSENLSRYVVTTSTPWKLTPEGEAIGLSPAGLRRFQTAEQIRKNFFGSGALGVRYTIEVVGLDAGASSMRLTVDGAVVENAHTPSRPVAASWPGEPGVQGARIEFVRAAGGQAAKTWPGEWSLFRLLNDATPISSQPADVTFEIAVEGLKARLRLRADSVNNPFTSQALLRASCAGKL